MLKPVLSGIVIVGMTVVLHACGILLWLRYTVERFNRLQDIWHLKRSLPVLIETVVVMIMLHVSEIVLWAMAYLVLPDRTGIITFADALYFSFVTFTTIGFGDITLLTDWRLLSGIEGINGIILCGLSTAVLFSILQGIWFRYSAHPVDSPGQGKLGNAHHEDRG